MGHCLRAGLTIMATDRVALPMLTESVEAIEALGRRANDRERAHAAAARTWLQGDFAGSMQRYGDILLDHPHDLLALQIAHVGDFFLGACIDAARPGRAGAADMGHEHAGLRLCARHVRVRAGGDGAVFARRGHRPPRARHQSGAMRGRCMPSRT